MAGVVGREKCTSSGLTHALLRVELGVPGREPEPYDGIGSGGAARLVEEALLKRMRRLASDANGFRLPRLPLRPRSRFDRSYMLDAAKLCVCMAYGDVPLVECDVPGRETERMLPLTTPLRWMSRPKNWPSPSAFWSIFFHSCGAFLPSGSFFFLSAPNLRPKKDTIVDIVN